MINNAGSNVMSRLKPLIFLVSFILFQSIGWGASITGLWTTIDDKTGEKRAVVDLTITNGVLNGRVVKIYHQPGDTGICSKCPGDFKDKPTMNLQIIWGLTKKDKNIWEGGHILDASTGKIYNLKLHLFKNKLYCRGYFGIPLLGRTQIWIR
jgi:uncharacterized protein (DUF2147 family)